jgi:transketolase
MQSRELPSGWDADLPVFQPDKKGIASRDSSGTVLNVLAKNTRGCWVELRTSRRQPRHC